MGLLDEPRHPSSVAVVLVMKCLFVPNHGNGVVSKHLVSSSSSYFPPICILLPDSSTKPFLSSCLFPKPRNNLLLKKISTEIFFIIYLFFYYASYWDYSFFVFFFFFTNWNFFLHSNFFFREKLIKYEDIVNRQNIHWTLLWFSWRRLQYGRTGVDPTRYIISNSVQIRRSTEEKKTKVGIK